MVTLIVKKIVQSVKQELKKECIFYLKKIIIFSKLEESISIL